jgi:glycosyltransferase involved in cell wall biosynthesis
VKITLVGPAPPLRGGIAHHIYRLDQQLKERGHHLQVISYKKLYPKFLFPGRTVEDESRLKLESHAAPLLSPLDPRTWIRAFREIAPFAPDAAVIQWWNPFFAPAMGALAAMLKMAGIKTVFECHNVFPHERSLLDLPLLDFVFSTADFFITHSEKDRLDLLSIRQAGRVSVASLPALAEFTGNHKSDRSGRTILFFGIVRKYKGLDTLLRAMPKVLSEVDCRLIVAGEFYDSVEKYEEIIRRSGIEKHVQIENRYVANEEVPALFEEADVLVLPYLSATQSGVAGIAAVNRLPVIASRAGGLEESVRDGIDGLLFPPGDASALADALVRYFREELGPLFSRNIRSRGDADSQIARIIEEMARFDDL